ncbi:MAG: MFS transporter, partial [Anaerolineales bacterium]
MRRDLMLIAVSMFAWGCGEGMFLYFQPIYLQQMGADPLKIGAILGMFGVVMTITHIPAGYLADRIGRKPLMVSGWVLGVVATWTMALANSLPVLVVGFLTYGITLFVISPLYSYVTAARGNLSVGRTITLISACFNLGAVLGPWLGGQIGEQLGLRQIYYVSAWIFMASTIVILLVRPQPIEQQTPADTTGGWLINRRAFIFLGVIFLAMFAMFLPQPLSPNFMQFQRGLDLSQIGLLYSITGIGVVVLSLILGQLPARTGFLLGQAAVGLFTIIIMRGTSLPWYFLGFFLLGGYKTARSLALAQVRQMVHQARMGIAYGLTETINSAAIILAPILAGVLYTFDPLWMYTLAAILIALSLLASIRYSPRSIDLSSDQVQPGAVPIPVHNPPHPHIQPIAAQKELVDLHSNPNP